MLFCQLEFWPIVENIIKAVARPGLGYTVRLLVQYTNSHYLHPRFYLKDLRIVMVNSPSCELANPETLNQISHKYRNYFRIAPEAAIDK